MKRTPMIIVAIAASAATAAPAVAGGLFVPGYGSQAQPRAGAFVAKADDPTALFHNPAGLARQDGTAVHVGFNLLNFSQKFERAGVYEDFANVDEPYEGQPYPVVEDDSNPMGLGSTAAIPLIAASTDLGLGLPLRFGAGLLAANAYPFRDYENGYQFEEAGVPPPPTRYDVLSQEVIAAFPTVGAAYDFGGKLAIGATFSWGFAEVKAKKYVWALRNYEEYVGQDGEVILDATDSFIPGFSAGLLWAPMPSLEIGATYYSQKDVRAQGTLRATLGSGLGLPPGVPNIVEPVPDENAKCKPGGSVVAINGCLTLNIPRHAIVGARWIFRDGAREVADIELDVQWEDWSNGSDIELVADGQAPTGRALERVVSRHGFQDTYSVRLGGSVNLPAGANLVSLRGGVAYDTAAADESFTRLALDGMARTTVGLGLGFTASRYRVDLGAGAVLEGERTVTSGCNPSVEDPGCEGSGADTPVRERDAPDPEQPLEGPFNQIQSPFNDGVYTQRYLQASLGVTTWF